MITGIICEFNPFHKGHKYLIDTVKKDGGAVVCVMSSSFVQRGECAVFSKFDRAKTALENGADLVIELPSEYSTLSAQGFARAGCALLEATGLHRLQQRPEEKRPIMLLSIQDPGTMVHGK